MKNDVDKILTLIKTYYKKKIVFADPKFDGKPPLITNEEIDSEGQTIEGILAEEIKPEIIWANHKTIK